ERRADLGRVMAVVVHERAPCRAADHGEPPRHAAERGGRLLGDVERHLQLVRYRNGGETVEDVVSARHLDGESPERNPAPVRVEARLEPAELYRARRIVRLRIEPRADVAPLDTRQDVLDLR